MWKTISNNSVSSTRAAYLWILLFLLSSFFYSAKASAQTAITITGTSPSNFNITIPEGVSTRSVRLAGDLSDIVVYVQRTSDPAAERTLTIPSSSNTLIGGAGLSVATIDAVEEIPDKVFHLKFALDSPAPAGDVWLIRLSKPSGDTRTLYWMDGELSDAVGATYVPDVFAEPSPLEFGSVIVGDESTLTLTVHNRFAADMTLAATLEHGDRGFSISGSVATPVTGVSSTDIDISFSPADTDDETDTLHLATNDPDTPIFDVTLEGSGTTRRIVLALDYSGSMKCEYDEAFPCDNALENSRSAQVRNALESFLQGLEIGVSPETLGSVRMGAVRFGGGTPSVDVLYPTSPINGPHINAMKGAIGVPYSTETGPTATGLTRISDALNECLTLFGDSNEGAILLMSDGYAEPSDQDPRGTGVLDTVSERGIPVFAVAFGENGTYVDHELLNDIHEETNGEFVVFGAGSGASIPADLASIYTKVLDIAFGTEVSEDPTVVISKGGTQEKPFPVGPSDRRLEFYVSWERGTPDLLEVSIIAPDGTEITPEAATVTDYVFNREGSLSSNYSVNKHYLAQQGKLGEWKLKVHYPNEDNAAPHPNEVEFSYSTLVVSDLNMDVRFDKTQYYTGDSVRIEAQIVDRGKPVTGADVRLNPGEPDVSIGNWFALNTISAKEFAALQKKYKLEKSGIPLLSQKAYILAEEKKIAPPKIILSNAGEKFYDDGTHGDTNENDGVYTYVSSPLEKTGLHTFLISANGKGLRDYSFKREKRLDQYVKLRPFLELSTIAVAYLETIRGFAFYEATIQIKDQYGNVPRPGLVRDYRFAAAKGIELIDSLKDNLDGTYTQKIKIPENTSETLSLNVSGITITKEITQETPPPSPPWWIILVIIVAVVIFYIIRKQRSA